MRVSVSVRAVAAAAATHREEELDEQGEDERRGEDDGAVGVVPAVHVAGLDLVAAPQVRPQRVAHEHERHRHHDDRVVLSLA